MGAEKNFGFILRKLRRTRGLNQQQLAELIGVKQAAISQYERGRKQPSLTTLVELAKALKVGVDVLLGNDINGLHMPINGYYPVLKDLVENKPLCQRLRILPNEIIVLASLSYLSPPTSMQSLINILEAIRKELGYFDEVSIDPYEKEIEMVSTLNNR